MAVSYLTYMTDTKKPVTERTGVDGIQIVLCAQMLGRNITIVCPGMVWCSDASIANDIVMIYTRSPMRQFYPTQVGNCFFFSIFHNYFMFHIYVGRQ